MPTTTKMTITEAQAALAADPAWQAESKRLMDFMQCTTSGQRLSHAEFAKRFRRPDGSFNPTAGDGWVNALTLEYRRRLDALTSSPAPAVVPSAVASPQNISRISPAIQAPPATTIVDARAEEERIARASWDRTIDRIGAAAKPGAKVPDEKHEADARAAAHGWDRAIARLQRPFGR
ncbi:hypothetical protein LMIY3S_02723 [Labrys miyagiensis]